MIQFKVCPRCRGDLYLKEDVFGKYLSCLQCGYVREIGTVDRHSSEGPAVPVEEGYDAA